MTEQAKILLVDDDEGLLQLLKMRLGSEGHIVDTAEDAGACVQKLDIFEPDLIITDLRMDEVDGLELFDKIRQRRPYLPVVLMSAHGTIPEAVEATQKGVFSFLPKPIDKDTLFKVIAKALPQGSKDAPADSNSTKVELITQSPAMQEVLKKARLVSQSESHVLISGESGTGKELLAKSLHTNSRRKFGPFATVVCSDREEAELEQELFGNGTREHRGAFLSAKGGTVFLKDVNDLSSNLQTKLVRILEDRGFRSVSTSQASIDVRVISSARVNLIDLVKEGSFREDLFYLLNVIHIPVPALSERREDISILAKHFLTKIAARHRPRVKSFSPKALELLCSAEWPGNIRQLHNLVEKLVVLATASVVSESAVKEQLVPENFKPQQSLADAKSEFERQYLIQVLKQAKGNVSQAARAAKRNRTDFYKLMARHNLQPGQFKSANVNAP